MDFTLPKPPVSDTKPTNKTTKQKLSKDAKDDEGFAEIWPALVDSTIMRGNKQVSMQDMQKTIQSIITISNITSLVQIRNKEIEISNAVAWISIEKSNAEHAESQLSDQKLRLMGAASCKYSGSKKPSQAILEAELAATDDEFELVRKLHRSSIANLRFWENMYDLCMKTLDCLKQISITITAEMKMDPSAGESRNKFSRV